MYSRTGEEQLHSFLTSALDGSNQLPGLPIVSKGKQPSYPMIRKLGGPKSPSGNFGRVKSLGHAMNEIPEHPVHYTDYTSLVSLYHHYF